MTLLLRLARVPVLVETIMRLRTPFIEQRILQRGRGQQLHPALVRTSVLRDLGQRTTAPSSTCYVWMSEKWH
jgi:hypothetical protein